jgi:hypothetical protein
MTAPIAETPQQAAQRLAAPALRDGFQPAGLHEYCDSEGQPWCWRIRCKHRDTGEKWIRPMRRNGVVYVIGEPIAPSEGKPLYRLPELLADPSALVWIVEGEPCADELANLGLVATTSGSADSAGATDWTPLRGRSVRLWPDHDAAGAKYADAVAERLRVMGCAVERIAVEALNLPDKGDCVDWIAQHPDVTAADVLRLPTASIDSQSIAPEPLRRPLPPSAPYPLDALGELLGQAAARVHTVVQAAAALCGQSFLAAASLAVQAHADVAIDGRREPLSLWHVTVGESGERKSAADGWALRAHREHERERWEAYRHEQAEHEIELSAYKAATRHAEGKKGTAIRDALAALGTPPEPPLSPLLLLSEPTLEGLHKLCIFGRPSLGVFNDDAGDFLDGHAMSRDNRAKSAAGFSKLWDSGEFSRVRSGDGAAKFYGRRLALHVMVQPVIAERVLSDDVLTGQGFLARTLLAWPESTAGTRRYVESDLSADPALARYWARMRDLLAAPPPLRQGTRNELEPRALSLAPDAKTRWIEIANAVESDMATDFAGVRAWASKGPAQVLRVAGVLTLVEDPDAGVIRLDAIERAARLALYHLGEAARVVGTASVPAKLRHAESLLQWCRDTGRAWLYSSDALRYGPNVIRTKDAFAAAVGTLQDAGWADYVEGGAELDGRRRAHVWRVRLEETG